MTSTEQFRAWLLKNKSFQAKSAGDVISRFRHVEKVLDISLERTVTSAKELDEVLQSLNQQRGNYLTFSSVPSLRRAVRLYYEFVTSKPV